LRRKQENIVSKEETINLLKRHNLNVLYSKLEAEHHNARYSVGTQKMCHEQFADEIQDAIDELEEEAMETRPDNRARVQELQDQIDSLMYAYESLGDVARSEVHRQRNPLIKQRNALMDGWMS
jgi:hypothetical protein